MAKNTKIRLFFLLFTFLYIIALYFFYIKYVPLVKNFQIILAPILFIVFIFTLLSLQWGALFFLFAFPLINNLPYFFGIFEHVPHAPTALVLFLFYFFGVLVRLIFFPSELSLETPIFKPMIIFSICIFLSGLITFLRYCNFYPILSNTVY